MAFSDKKGINVASPFKLQAEELLDVRQKVDTIAERDELVTIHAAAPGLRVFVKANKTTYIYNGSGWDALISSANIGNQSVTTATKLSSSAGSATQPIYFSNGKPAACSYTLGKSVPSNAVFTDTTYSDMKGATSTGVGTHGLVPAPSAGTANRYLRSDGTWAVPPDTNTTYTLGSFGITASAAEINYTKGVTSSIQTQLNGKAASSHSHSTATTSAAGFMPKLNGSTSNYLRGDGTWATPPNTNTDTKVTQTAVAIADYTNWRSIPWGSSNSGTEGFSPTTVTDVTYTTSNLSFQPSTGTLKATVFKGSLSGNATSASSATTATTSSYLKANYIENNTDLNSITTPGFYYNPANANVQTFKNCPTTNALFMIVGAHAGTYQEITEYTTSNPKKFMRNYYNGTWSPWYRVYTSANAPTKAEVGLENVNNTSDASKSVKHATSSDTATALASSAGSTTQPIYFSGGKPVACSYTLGKSVPSNAVFTDTNTWIALKGSTTSAAGAAGYAPAPAAGVANRYLRCDGTWQVPPDTNTNTWIALKGATASAAGTAGYAPAPAAGAANRYLRSDGTWAVPPNDNTTYSLSSFGITASAAEINYTKGVTSSIQTQLNGKAASSHSHSAATTSAAGFMPKLNGSTSNYLRGDGTWATPPDTNTNTWIAFKGATTSAAGTAGYAPAPSAGAANRYLRSDGTWSVPPDTNTTYPDATTSAHGLMTADMVTKLNGIAAGANAYSHPTSSGNKHIPSGGSSGQILRWSADGTAVWGSDNNTWIAFKGATTSAAGTAGYAPAPAAGAANRYLRCDGTWQVPPDTNTTYSLASFGISASAAELNYTKGVTSSIQTQLNGKAASSHSHSTASTSAAGFMPKLNGSTSNYLRGDGTWATPPNTNTDTKVTNTASNTTTAYITGTTSSSTNTGTQVFDTGVYLTSTSGRMHAESLEIGGAILTYDSTNKSLTISFS